MNTQTKAPDASASALGGDFAIIEARVKAFARQGLRLHKIAVTPDGIVLVWDDVAGHYTTCHCMSTATQRRIRKRALKGTP